MNQETRHGLLASRRAMLAAASAAGAAALVGGRGQQAAAAQVAVPHGASEFDIAGGKLRVSLDDRPLDAGELGRLSSFGAEKLPTLEDVILRIQRLAPGAAREPHWHADKDELNYVIEGTGEIGIVGRDNTLARIPLTPGTVTHIPRGLTHYIVNSGDTELRMVISFNGITNFTFNHSNMLQAFSLERFAQSSQTALDETPTFVRREAALYTQPAALPTGDPAAGPTVDGVLTSVNIADVAGFDLPDGNASTVTQATLPGLHGISLGVVRLQPGAMRDIHWHVEGHELAFIVAGDVEWGSMAAGSDGRTDVFLSRPGDVVNNPVGWLHYAANVGDTPAEFVVVWSSENASAIDLSTLLGVIPAELSAASSGGDTDQAYFDQLFGEPRRYIVPELK